ncbi:hypothetical protein PM082_021995 [Marasmius tenuissimus]|nr:hypothetical protein PM082_021995 [Marasmius tenuissimus]
MMETQNSYPKGDEDHILQSLSCFPNATRAIEYLQKAGSPRPTIFDVLNPKHRIQKAAEAITALSSYTKRFPDTTVTQLRAHLVPVVSPWIAFFLLNAVSYYQDHPIPTETIIFDHILFSVPPLFFGLFPGDLKLIGHTTPTLRPLVAQVWLYLLHNQSNLLGWWSTVLHRLVDNFDKPGAPPQFSNVAGVPRPYRVDTDLGRTILGRLDSSIGHLRKMNPLELTDFNMFVVVSMAVKQHFPKAVVDPLWENANVGWTLRSIVRILNILLRKLKPLPDQPIEGPKSEAVYRIVASALRVLPISLISASKIQHIVNSGIILALYHAQEYFYQMDKVHGDKAPTPKDRFLPGVSRALGLIGTFLVYPSVLRSFVRSTRKLPKAFPRCIQESEQLNTAWMDITRKAESLQGVRHTYKLKCRCEFEGCTLRATVKQEQPSALEKVKYLRCSGCSSKIYCSATCRKADWRAEHKAECARLSKALQSGSTCTSTSDLAFFEAVIHSYIATHFKTIIIMLTTYHQIESTIFHLINRPGRNPVLFLPFDRSDIPSLDVAQLLDADATINLFESHISGDMQSYRNPEPLRSFKAEWEQTNSADLMVFATYPFHTGLPQPFVTRIFLLEKKRMY